MENKINELKTIAENFGSIAEKVNGASQKRKQCAEEIRTLVDEAIEIVTKLLKSMQLVSDSNIKWLNQDNMILSSCRMLNCNLERQKKIIEEINKKAGSENDSLKSMLEIINSMIDAINQVKNHILDVIGREHDVLLLDSLLLRKKNNQMDSIKTLKNLTLSALDDAVNAIEGSGSNFKRGRDMVEKLKNIETFIEKKDTASINTLVSEAHNGWNIAFEVNKSSRAQYDFNKKVNDYTINLYNESVSIKDIVVQKHNTFEENLQLVSVYTVLITMDFPKFLNIKDVLSKATRSPETKELYNELTILVDMACEAVEKITKLNLDMTDISHSDNEFETNTIDATKKELKIFDDIKKKIQEMTDITAYPVEGSSKNIENGKKIEALLKDIFSLGDNAGAPEETKVNEQPAPKSDNSAKRILIIDDALVIRQVVTKVLTSANYSVVEAGDGKEGLDKLDGSKYDLILCDVNMPNLDGIGFLENVKNDPKYMQYKFTPIIMLTTEAGESMKEKGKELGAKAWLVKPFKPDVLLEKVKLLAG